MEMKGKTAVKEAQDPISKAAKLSCDIKDIRDELHIIRTITQYQKTVQDSLNDKQSNHKGNSEAAIPAGANRSATHIIKDITRMDMTANRIHSAVLVILKI